MTSESRYGPDDSEFSREISLDYIRQNRVAETELEATSAECHALAKRFNIDAIDHLRAKIRMQSKRGGREVALTGSLNASVVQTCSVTLEPFSQTIEAVFDVIYKDAIDSRAEDDQAHDQDLEDLNAPEPLEGDVIDIGEATAQQLALELDPFPRSPGATFVMPGDDGAAAAESDDAEPRAENPFSSLAALKDKLR